MQHTPHVCILSNVMLYSLDWIEDAIVERNRRLRVARDALAGRRGPNGEITLHWLFWQARAIFDASQTWIVVSIAGACILIPGPSFVSHQD